MRVSNNLESCTQDVQMAPDFKIGDQTIKLIDTPGFNDTDRSEVEILKLIADFLAFQSVAVRATRLSTVANHISSPPQIQRR